MLKGLFNTLINSAKQAMESQGSSQQAPAASSKTEAYDFDGAVVINGINYSKIYNVSREHFTPIIRNNFQDYYIEENVPVSSIKPGASEAFNKLDFVLSQGGKMVAAIVIVPKGKAASKKAEQICIDNGIKYIRFYSMYENTESYVVDRIRKALA